MKRSVDDGHWNTPKPDFVVSTKARPYKLKDGPNAKAADRSSEAADAVAPDKRPKNPEKTAKTDRSAWSDHFSTDPNVGPFSRTSRAVRAERAAARRASRADRSTGTTDWFAEQKSIARTARTSSLPVWFWPLIILLALIVAVFLIVPIIVERSTHVPGGGEADGSPAYISLYDQNVRVVKVPVSSVYNEPDIKSTRLTQVLFNTPVQLDPSVQSPTGFCYVTLLDGRKGYMMPTDLSQDRQSIEPNLYHLKVIVTDLNKRIMTHATNGNLLMEVKRGTMLYVLYSGNDLFRVQLPDGVEGWMSASGLMVLPVQSGIPRTDPDRFTASLQVYDQSRWMENGMSDEGIDMNNVLRITAHLNGIELPADNDALWNYGESLAGAVAEGGRLDTSVLRLGDIVFCERIVGYDTELKPVADPENRKIAVWIGGDTLLTESTREFAITKQTVKTLEDNWIIVRVTRYFPPA